LYEPENFWRLVSDGQFIRVHRDTVVSASDRSISLSSGTTIGSDVICFATGWNLGHTELFDESIREEIGVPIPISCQSTKALKMWNRLETEAEIKILTRFPILQNPPYPPSSQPVTPFRLYRMAVPPGLAARGDRSLAFAGLVANTSTATISEASGIWIAAYLENKLPQTVSAILLDQEAMNEEIAEQNMWQHRRYLSCNAWPRALLETQSWIDLLIQDLECNPRRKSKNRGVFSSIKNWAFEHFTAYTCQDYAGLQEEFLKTLGTRDKK
jgi:dimethylaniline monooxygenase (N-oxide forming)